VDLLRRIHAEPTGLAQAAAALVAGAVLSLLLWYPLGLPSEVVRNVIARPTAICRYGDFFAADRAAGSLGMYLCSAAVGLLTFAGPVALLVLAFVLRRRIGRLVASGARFVPAEARFLVAPLLATALFGLAWSGSHYTTAWNVGLLPQTFFPGVVGLFTFAVARWGPPLQARLARFFDLRDRFSLGLRVAAAFAVPIVLSLLLTRETRVSLTAVKEQTIVLVGLLSAFLALAPRRGDLMAGVRHEVATVAHEVNAQARQRIAAARAGRR